MTKLPTELIRFSKAIASSGLSIYDPIPIGDPALWIPTPELQILLHAGLLGVRLSGLPLRTRSKVVKQHVCRILGYSIPKSFKKTQPRFPGQLFDTYVQKANNLQVWNEELVASRRYVIIRISEQNIVTSVRVVTGDTLAVFDTTGTLTQKYQATCIPGNRNTELIVAKDTHLLSRLVSSTVAPIAMATPVNDPCAKQLLPIAVLFDRLKVLVGESFPDTGYDQERNRGGALHAKVCRVLGYDGFQDDGKFPDVRHQLLEVKLQTSRTIDLGLVRPDSNEALNVPKINGKVIRHCDVRYGIFYARIDGSQVILTHFLLTTGKAFFNRFPQFQGKVLNKKLQIPLPADFFDA